MEIKKFVRVLSVGAILGGLVSVGIPIDAKADINGYTIKVENEIYVYDKFEVMQDFLNYKRGNTAKLYNEFSDKLKKGNGFYAFKDSKKGYIDYGIIKKEFLKTKHENKVFNIEEFVQSKESKVMEVSWTKKAVITKDGQIEYETPLNNDSDNKNNDAQNKENGNNSTDSKDVVNNDNKTSENSTSSNHKHRHKHNSSSVVKENKEEKKSDVVQKDDKKDKEDKQKQEQLKKNQAEKEKQDQVQKQKAEEVKKQEELRKQKEAEAKAKDEAEKQKESEAKQKEAQNKAKQEQLKKEQEEKEKQAKMEAEKQKAEQQKQQAKAEAEKIQKEKQAQAEKQKAEEVKKQEELREQKEAEAKAKDEAEKQKESEAKQKEAQEKAKQEQLKKEQEEKIKAEQAEKEKQAKMEAEKKKVEQQQKEAEARAKAEKAKQEQQAREEAERIEKENNRLIEEAKSNINLGDLTNIKSNLTLPNKDANGVQVIWKSSDESVIKNDGTVKRQSADKGDKKVTLTATFTKDSLTSTKDFEVIVKAEEKLKVKTEEEEIAELLKADKKIEVTQPEKFDKVMKEAIRQLKPSFTVMVPYNESEKYNFDNFNNIMVQFGGEDYGKPAISTLGGSFTVVNGKIPMTVQLNYRRDINEVKRQKNATEAAVKKIIKEVIKPGMTDVEKELALHDYVVKHADYNMEGLKKNPADLEDHSAYGVLVLGKGVCESYAKAMHLLLNEVGIECKYATGNKVNQDGSIGGGHAWNMVKLDNEWYNLDATWDDPVSDRVGKSDKEVIVSPVIHTYFNVTDGVFNKDHKRGVFEEKNYPAASGTKYAYDKLDVDEFMNDGTKVPSVESREELKQKLIQALKSKKTSVYLRLKGFKMTQQELMNLAGEAVKGKLNGSYGVSPTDSSHAYYNFMYK